MDTSKTYIKMCEEAEEIQGEWEPQEGDYIHILKHGAFIAHEAILFSGLRDTLITMRGWHEDWEFEREYSIWLPRQGQLQEILEWTNINTLLAEILDFAGFPESYGKHPDPQIETLVYKWDSMEQLWLAFVQKELHSEVWNGNEWIGEKK